MTSASLARDCIKVVAPLIDMIVDDDDDHIGQLKYPDEVKTNKDAKEFLNKLTKAANDACVELKSGLDSLDGKSKKVDRNTEEGILIHMTLQAIRLLPEELARLEKLEATDDVERFFPLDMADKRVEALQKLIKKHNGDADAESVVSLSESAYPTKKIIEAVVASEPAESSVVASESSTEPVVSDPAASEPAASESSEPAAPVVETSESESAVASEPVVASESVTEPVVASIDEDESESLIEQASDILEEPVEPVVKEVVVVDYSGMSRDDLLAAKRKFKTHKQKDAFIQDLIDALTGGKSVSPVVVEEKVVETVVPAGAFVVEDVSKFKRSKGGVEQVLVKWKDYPVDQMTWETKTDELSRSNVGGSFFVASDTSYKKFCERVGLTSKDACAKIDEKDKAKCKKRNESKAQDEKSEDCDETVTFIDVDESDAAPADDSQDISDASSTTTAAVAASVASAASSDASQTATAEAVEEATEEVEEEAAEDESAAIADAIEESL